MSMPPQKTLQAEVQHDDLDVFAGAGELDAIGEFAKHGFVQEIVLGATQRHVRHAGVQAHLHKVIVFDTFSSAVTVRNSSGLTASTIAASAQSAEIALGSAFLVFVRC